MKKILFIGMIFFTAKFTLAQTQFISKGIIEFEKRTNMWADLKGSYAEQMKKAVPEYKTNFFNYEFENNKSIYAPGRESNDKPSGFLGMPATDNEVYSDYKTRKYIARKSVFEKTFLIEDSLRNTTWKITNDFREIAGFNCRRATTVIMDSVFVVAFYTDEIMISGGPESFNGLPGMIMGLVITRLHTTWYATKVQVNGVDEKNITPPKSGKKTDNEQLLNTLKRSMSVWGADAVSNIWATMI
jgi:GLPGLI family protein